jgi:hypothetical protein
MGKILMPPVKRLVKGRQIPAGSRTIVVTVTLVLFGLIAGLRS